MKKVMNFFKMATVSCALLIGSVVGLSTTAMAADEAPDQLVKRLSTEILDAAKTDKEIQNGNRGRINELVETKVLPFIDFNRMTSLAVGKSWRDSTPEQQKQLINEFRTLLIHTYSGAITQIRDQRVEFKPLRAAADDTEVEVKSLVIQSRGEPLQLNYRLEKTATGWKIFDINVLGAWLVETYKGNFAAEISKNGVDGLIKTLSEKNKKLASAKK